MASKVLYNGSAIATPGVYPTVEAGDLNPLSVASTNVIAVIGGASGGIPISSSMTYDEVYEASVFTGDIRGKLLKTFQSGDLRDAALYASGKVSASRMICMKVNQDTAASVTVPGKTESSVYFGDVLTVETKNSGARQNAVSLALSGTGNAVDVSLTAPTSLPGYPVTGVDIGDDAAFTALYDDGSANYGWTTCRAAITDSELLGAATRTGITKSESPPTLANFAGGLVYVTMASWDALNLNKILRVYGLVGGEPAYEDIILTNTATTIGTVTFDASGVLAAAIFTSGGAPSTVEGSTTFTIDDSGGGSSVDVLSSADTTGAVGMTRFYNAPVHPGTTLTAVNASTDTGDLYIFGSTGGGARSGIALALSGTTPVESSAVPFSYLEGVVTSGISSTNATTLAAIPFYASFETYPTVSQLSAYLDTVTGITATLSDPTASNAACSTLDLTDGYVSLLTTASFYRTVDRVLNLLNSSGSPVTAERTAWVPHSFTLTDGGSQSITLTPIGETAVAISGIAATADVVDWYNRHPNSRFFMSAVATSSTVATVTAKTTLPILATGAASVTYAEVDAPDGPGFFDTTASLITLPFTGGTDVAGNTNDYVTALEKLRDFDCDSIVVLSSSSAVHDALISHLEYRAGRGGSESQGFVGILNAAGDDVPTKTELRTDIRALNTRHLTVWGQALSWDNIDSNGKTTEEEFLPHIACIVPAVLQARANIGVPISRKELSSIGIEKVRSDTSWDPREDSDEMLDYGLTFAEMVPQTGAIRLVRHITAHLTDDNIAFVNGSVNRLVNFVVRTFRRDMESFLAQPGTVKTVNNVRSFAIRRLDRFVRDEQLVSWDSLTLSLELDVLSIGVAISPVVDINFILPTFYLKAANITV